MRRLDRRRASDLLAQARDIAGALDAPRSPLTPRELQVLEGLVEGQTYAQIAARLFISDKTVSTHVSSLLRKTGTSSRIERADLARRGLGAPGG